MNQTEQDYSKAKKIAEEIVSETRKIIKKNSSLLEISESIEQKIKKSGAEPAFPINFSINETAAHHIPLDKEEKAEGLLKIDLGVQINSIIFDTAFTVDLTGENQKLVEASEKALQEALKIAKEGIEVRMIGKVIQETIEKSGFNPIINLSGHEIKEGILHSGLTIPNHDNNDKTKLKKGMIIAIEPFATKGQGLVYDGKASGIYKLEEPKNVRLEEARKIIEFIYENYKLKPFSELWIKKKFPNAFFYLKYLVSQGVLHQYAELVEKSHNLVSQAETTVII